MPTLMRRWFAILLLVLLPLQSLWAAAAPYCAHEESPTTMHVGHHAHEHQDAQQDEDVPEGPGASHADCHVCHGAGAAVTAVLEASSQRGHSRSLPMWARALPIPPVFQPDRPNWARLA